MNAIAQALEPIVGDSSLYSWENVEPSWQERIASIAEHSPSYVVYPNSVEQLANVMNLAHRNSWTVLPCGSGSKLSWGGVGKTVDIVISTQRLNRIIEHAVGDLTVTVEAGVKLADLQAILAKTGQFLALDPAYPEDATLGGIVTTADSGSLRHRYGGIRDMLLGISLVRSDGQIAKAGGRVVKNVAGYDLMKLFTGSYGTLGILTEVTFRVYPIPAASGTVVLTGEAEAIASATKTLLASALTPTAVDLLSTQLVNQLGLGNGIGLMVRFQSVIDSVKEQSSRMLDVGKTLGLQGTLYTDADEVNLWQSLPKKIWTAPHQTGITCKIGVLPTAAVVILTQLDSLTPSPGLGLIHAGSGLGLLRFEWGAVKSHAIAQMRHYCEEERGFLTVLEAPISFKQQVDVWGYKGNALNVMQGIKQKFDPKNLLNPHRFVAGI